MEDSIELSSERDDSLHEMNEIVSPKNRKLTKGNHITASQESLAYSNSTLTKGNRTQRTNRQLQKQRSPPSIFSDLKNKPYNLNFDNKNKKNPFDKKYSTGMLKLQESGRIQQKKNIDKEDIQMPNFTSQQNSPIKIFPDQESNQNTQQIRTRIKTQNQSDQRKRYEQIRYKNKELEYALQVQMINSQQLRAKMQVLNELLQNNLKKNQFNLYLFKNSSRNLSHIDLYVELQRSEKLKKQFEIQNQRLRQDLQQNKKELQKIKQKGKKQIKTQTSYISNINQSCMINPSDLKEELGKFQEQIYRLQEQIHQLKQEKQGLFNFIQQQTKLIQEKDGQLILINQQISLLRQKEQRFCGSQRPKLLKQLDEISLKNKFLVQEMQKKQMQQSLTQLKYQEIINSLKEIHIRQIEQKEQLIQRLKTQSQRFYTESDEKHVNNYQMNQTQNFDAQVQTNINYLDKQSMIVELMLLKKQRDYFLTQSMKNTILNKEIFELRLKIQKLQTNLEQYQHIFIDENQFQVQNLLNQKNIRVNDK